MAVRFSNPNRENKFSLKNKAFYTNTRSLEPVGLTKNVAPNCIMSFGAANS